MIRIGLCCIFRNEPIRFRRTTAAFMKRKSRKDQLGFLSELILHNAESLKSALVYCKNNGIGAFRVNSQILPLKTHPEVGYRLADLPDYRRVRDLFDDAGAFCRENDIRTTFHPDQFIILSSPKGEVVQRSLADLEYHARISDRIGADVINIHGGGAYGDKAGALERLTRRIEKLPGEIRSRLTLENDDRVYTPADLFPVCDSTGIPLVYDVHHHRCLPDGLSEAAATKKTIRTWDREPLFHVSSPLNRSPKANRKPHHDYISWEDVPLEWLETDIDITVEMEAKAKELAVLKLKKAIDIFKSEINGEKHERKN